MTAAPRAVSIRQPWAWAVLSAGEDVEDRAWRGAPRHRGALVVHAGARREPEAASRWLHDAFGLPAPASLPLGAFLGAVQVVSGRRVGPGRCASPQAARDAGVHIQLADPRPFPEPVPGEGRLGLWRPEAALPAGGSQ
jgi:hypothetical protein